MRSTWITLVWLEGGSWGRYLYKHQRVDLLFLIDLAIKSKSWRRCLSDRAGFWEIHAQKMFSVVSQQVELIRVRFFTFSYNAQFWPYPILFINCNPELYFTDDQIDISATALQIWTQEKIRQSKTFCWFSVNLPETYCWSSPFFL